MASSSKRLWEYLQEQQKPFVLDAYLSERKIMLNKKQKRPRSYDLNKRRIEQTRKILKLLLLKFTRTSQNQPVSSFHKAQKHDPVSKTIEKPQQFGEIEWLPTGSSSVAVRESFRCNVKDSHFYENHASHRPKTSQPLTHSSLKQKAAADTNFKWECKEENEQLSPVSVLNELPSINKVCRFLPKQEGKAASASSTVLSRNAEEDNMLSAFLCDLLVISVIEKHSLAGFAELQEVVGPAFSQHLKNNRVLRQNMQLLFDCVNEAMEVHRRMHRRKQHAQEFIGLQELGKIICEQICSWGKQEATEQININVSSTVEYGCYLQQRIGTEIGDAILNEIIQEVLDLFLQ
ncbi:uncharacterized protein [Populus alba]|uniref:DUF4378 domain-containing protein n=2 Tax=Populus TaxID=3689 RepID=A0A4U5Q5W2_POPAL|nr:uncharacterized protein LOC118059002 [Populus alba]KAJ6985149.1 hypothetical protein NC653_023200 [Populus alba x Populus x berolinensis]TKS05112.1 hypothetical protein D5086_0000132090 [Populus alba]